MIRAIRGLLASALLSASIGLQLYRDEFQAAIRRAQGRDAAPRATH